MSESPVDNLAVQGEDASERLVIAAERLFAEKGFDGTSVREITSAAGCNVAGINYHFGSKEKLYQEVFHRRFHQLRDLRVDALDSYMSNAGPDACLEGLLKVFCQAFLDPLVDKSDSQMLTRLFCREMNDRYLPENFFFDEMVLPVETKFAWAIREVCPSVRQERVAAFVHSVIGQLVHVVHLVELSPSQKQSDLPFGGVDSAIDHIVGFSAAGIRGLAGAGCRGCSNAQE